MGAPNQHRTGVLAAVVLLVIAASAGFFMHLSLPVMALLSGDGPPGPSYAGAGATDIFLVAILPIGVPVLIGTVCRANIASLG